MATQLLRASALNTDSPLAEARQQFCLALKAARERNGISLDQISAATKIPASVFAALERNDVSRWPRGLFRRSFFRDYVRTIGLPVSEACAEFVRLFPEDQGVEPIVGGPASSSTEPTQADETRLALDAAWQGPRGSGAMRFVAALIDAATVVFSAMAVAWVADANPWTWIAIVALTYFSLATAWLGESPAKWTMSKAGAILVAMAQASAAGASPWTSGAEAVSHLFKGAEEHVPETPAETETREWISDARRVGPAPSSRLRVRIKMSQ